MSQAKVDQYKKEKANRKETMAKEKVKRTIGKIVGTVVGIALVAWIGISTVNFVIDNRPVSTFFCQVDALDDYLSGLYEEETETSKETEKTESTEDTTENTTEETTETK